MKTETFREYALFSMDSALRTSYPLYNYGPRVDSAVPCGPAKSWNHWVEFDGLGHMHDGMSPFQWGKRESFSVHKKTVRLSHAGHKFARHFTLRGKLP